MRFLMLLAFLGLLPCRPVIAQEGGAGTLQELMLAVEAALRGGDPAGLARLYYQRPKLQYHWTPQQIAERTFHGIQGFTVTGVRNLPPIDLKTRLEKTASSTNPDFVQSRSDSYEYVFLGVRYGVTLPVKGEVEVEFESERSGAGTIRLSFPYGVRNKRHYLVCAARK